MGRTDQGRRVWLSITFSIERGYLMMSRFVHGAAARAVFALVFVCAARLTCQSRLPQSTTSLAALRSDIRASAEELERAHPALKGDSARRAFRAAMARVYELPLNTPRARTIVEWARAIATLRDGHTQLGLSFDDKIGFHRFPLQLYWFSDGFFVIGVAPGQERLLGANVLRIGRFSIDSAVQSVLPIIHGDNEMAHRDILPSRLVLAEVLEATGVIGSSGPTRFVLRLADGTTETVALGAAPVNEAPAWVTARSRLATLPLYLQHPGDAYWFSYLAPERTMYVQFNEVRDKEEEPLAQFSTRLFATADSVKATRLVLDIRRNNGGDNTILWPLERAIIRSSFDHPGGFYVITGRLTFSAAVNLAADLERRTTAIFVGEPTEAPPNHFGETKRVVLPRTGIIMLESTEYWQGSDPRDHRREIAPSLPVTLSSHDYFAGLDPVLTAILARP
jgi:hypothetical protein